MHLIPSGDCCLYSGKRHGLVRRSSHLTIFKDNQSFSHDKYSSSNCHTSLTKRCSNTFAKRRKINGKVELPDSPGISSHFDSEFDSDEESKDRDTAELRKRFQKP
jgi:hypothetical protein